MPNDQDAPEKNDETALNALNFFVSKYDPATKADADSYFTTAEISRAVAEHTGITLSNAEIYSLLDKMKYSYDLINGEFYWLMKK